MEAAGKLEGTWRCRRKPQQPSRGPSGSFLNTQARDKTEIPGGWRAVGRTVLGGRSWDVHVPNGQAGQDLL